MHRRRAAAGGTCARAECDRMRVCMAGH